MIRPADFRSNPETAASNSFQHPEAAAGIDTEAAALEEFGRLVRALSDAGVQVHVFDDTRKPDKPDAIFPNNWVSFHADGTVVLYPMMAPNRRPERRLDIIEALVTERGFHVTEVIDLSEHETEGRFLEATGSMVLDRVNRIAYACLSPRTHVDLLGEFGQRLDYEVVSFDALGPNDVPVYHTNVMMCVGDGFTVICAEAIPDAVKRDAVLATLRDTGHEVIEIDHDQMDQFAGNLLKLETADGDWILAMSRRAKNALSERQREVIGEYARIVSVPIDTIEDCSGGGVRCMLAEIFLPRKAK